MTLESEVTLLIEENDKLRAKIEEQMRYSQGLMSYVESYLSSDYVISSAPSENKKYFRSFAELEKKVSQLRSEGDRRQINVYVLSFDDSTAQTLVLNESGVTYKIRDGLTFLATHDKPIIDIKGNNIRVLGGVFKYSSGRVQREAITTVSSTNRAVVQGAIMDEISGSISDNIFKSGIVEIVV